MSTTYYSGWLRWPGACGPDLPTMFVAVAGSLITCRLDADLHYFRFDAFGGMLFGSDDSLMLWAMWDARGALRCGHFQPCQASNAPRDSTMTNPEPCASNPQTVSSTLVWAESVLAQDFCFIGVGESWVQVVCISYCSC